MKVFSQKMVEMDVYVQAERLEAFDAAKDYIHLGSYDGRDYFSYNPETVVLQKQDEKYDVKEYSPTKKDDKATLADLRTKLDYTRNLTANLKAELFSSMDLFDVLSGLSTNDKYVKDAISEIIEKIDAEFKNLGF
jgi:hypothetical protein